MGSVQRCAWVCVTRPALRPSFLTYLWDGLRKLCKCGCWKSKRQTLSFNIPCFWSHTVLMLKANSHVDLKLGEEGRLGKGQMRPWVMSPTLAGFFREAASYIRPTWTAISMTTLPYKPFINPSSQELHTACWFCRLSIHSKAFVTDDQ